LGGIEYKAEVELGVELVVEFLHVLHRHNESKFWRELTSPLDMLGFAKRLG